MPMFTPIYSSSWVPFTPLSQISCRQGGTQTLCSIKHTCYIGHYNRIPLAIITNKNTLPCPILASFASIYSNHGFGSIGLGLPLKGTFARGLRGSRPCKCSNAGLVELGPLLALDWRPALDHILLLTTVALAYVAGIVTPADPAYPVLGRYHPKTSTNSRNDKESIDRSRQKEADSRRRVEQSSFRADNVWNNMQQKLQKSVDIVDTSSNDQLLQSAPRHSLQALADGPKLRLLMTTSFFLQRKVENLCESRTPANSEEWLEICREALSYLLAPICKVWLLQEHPSMLNHDLNNALFGANSMAMDIEEKFYSLWNATFGSYADKLQSPNTMAGFLKSTGKASLYSDFLHFLCFGSLRVGSCCNLNVFMTKGNFILEDVVISLSDAVAALYLDLLSSENVVLSDNVWPNVLLPSISSTRALERSRNEVALHSWMYETFESVTLMFEDCFDLWVLKELDAEKSNITRSHGKKQSKEVDAKNAMFTEEAQGLVLSRCKISVKRTKELQALAGWRYYYSLYLEVSDIVGPILKVVLGKIGEGLSFLLSFFIGRSLGLIYKGILQSVRWGPDKRSSAKQSSSP